MQQVYILYHKKCSDGFGSAYAAWRHFQHSAEYIAWGHNEPLPEFKTNSLIYFCDICPLRDALLELRKLHHVIVIDHHSTALKDIGDLPDCHIDLTHSGSVLTWQFFHQAPMPKFLKYIELRDLFAFNEEEKIICDAVYSYPLDFQIWLDELENGFDYTKFKELGMAIRNAYNVQISFATQAIITLAMKGHLIPAINVKDNVSDLGNLLCKMFPDAKFAALFSLDVNNNWAFSLRSIGNFDVAELAKSFGTNGGGHKNSSGFKVPFDALQESITGFNISDSLKNSLINAYLINSRDMDKIYIMPNVYSCQK